MDYYSSKTELNLWTNDVLQLHLSRLEQFANGAVFCQLVDAYHADVVPMFKVNFYAREEYENLQNYKILQAAFTQLEITKELNVINLVRASTVECLELLQWLYRYLRRGPVLRDYDAKQRRSLSVRGGTSDVPVPSCITSSFDVYGRCQDLRFLSTSQTWGALGLEAPTSSNTSSGIGRVRSGRPMSARSLSPASPSGVRASMSAVPSRYRDNIVVTPSASVGGQTSDAGSDAEGLMKHASVSSMGTQTDVNAAGDAAAAAGGAAASYATTAVGPSEPSFAAAHPVSLLHRRMQSVDAGSNTSFGGSSCGVDAAVGTDGGDEGAGRSWQDAGADPMVDGLSVLALGVQSGDSSLGDLQSSSRHTTRSSAGTDAYSAALPATSTFMAPSGGQSDERSVGATAAAVSSVAAADMMAGALDTVHRSSKILRRSIPGLRRLVEMLGVRHAIANGAEQAAGGADGAVEAAEGGAAAGGGVSASAYTVRGKIRSLQDALQTLLRHTALLLADVQGYSAASSSGGVAGPRQDEGAAVEDGDGSSAHQQLVVRAAALLTELREMESEFVLISGMVRAVDNGAPLPPAAATALSPASSPASAAADGGSAALSDEQRALSNTAQLDACLKSVGLAQFGLVQGIHREIAQITAAFLKIENPTSDAGCGPDTSDDTSAANVRDNKAAAALPVKRMARVFKLGDYTLKQLRNGDVYKGRYLGNKKNGEGVYHFVNADVYEGEFKDDRMDGHGVYTFSHEGRYEGAWRHAVYSGCGTETFAKGSTYHGEYLAGLRNGWGACRFFNGDYYEGQWLKGLRDGRGMQQCTDDSNYVGDYARGKRHGHGVYSFANGDRYVGKYADDLPDGHGVYYFASGQRYEGQWAAGRKHGWSVYTVENGSRFVGQWGEGKPQWVQPLPEGVEPADVLSASSTAVGAGGEEEEGAGEPAAAWLALLPADAEPTLCETIVRASEAHRQAQTDAHVAEERAVEHWGGLGEIQAGIRDAVARAEAAAGVAQAARQRAQELAAKLDNAVALLQESTLGATAAAAGSPLGDGGASGGMLPAASADLTPQAGQDQAEGPPVLEAGRHEMAC